MNFDKWDWKKLNNRQWEIVYEMAEFTMGNATAIYEDTTSTHYVLIVPIGERWDYFDGIRVEVKREMTEFQGISGMGPVSDFLSTLMGHPGLIMQQMKVKTFIYLHVRGTPDNEVIVVTP